MSQKKYFEERSLDSFRSAYLPLVAFRDDVQSEVVENFIKEKVDRFFRDRPVQDPKRVKREDAITELDYQRNNPENDNRPAVKFDYIYKVVMKGAEKVNGKINHTAYTLTFDHVLTPRKCEHTGMMYGSLDLAGKPVLYYLRLDLPEIIGKVREHKFLP